MSAVAISIDNVSKSFEHAVKGRVYAARDVSLDVAPGEFVTLLGPSGCGKTTTLRMIAGFGVPDSGRILIGGDDVTHVAVSARNIGFVFQNYALFPHLSIFENIAYGLRVRGQAEAEIKRAVDEVMALVGLAGYERQFSSQLSGGEQQRVALARAIVIRPRVLLFDEPLSNLDARLRIQMRDEIRDLQKRLSITTVYVTHDQEEAMAVSDRIAVMSQGSIVQVGTAEDLYYRPASEFVARFVGKVNLVAGTIVADAAGARVEALGRRLAIANATGAAHAGSSQQGAGQPGDAVQIVLRPEAVGLLPAVDKAVDRSVDNPGDNVVDGVIRSRTFLGEKLEFLVDCGAEVLQVARHSAETGAAAMMPGARVRVRLPASVSILSQAA